MKKTASKPAPATAKRQVKATKTAPVQSAKPELIPVISVKQTPAPVSIIIDLAELKILTSERAALLLDVSERYIEDALRAGELKGSKRASRWYVTSDDLMTWIKSGAKKWDFPHGGKHDDAMKPFARRVKNKRHYV